MANNMVPVSSIERGIAAYLDAELMPKLDKTGWEKVIVGTAVSLAISKFSRTIIGYKDDKMIQMLGIMDDAGNIDVSAIAEEAKKNIDREGFNVDVPFLGTMTFHTEDVDKLCNFILEA